MVTRCLTLLLSLLLFSSTDTSGQRRLPTTKDDGKITMQFLQLNNVYEIALLEHGTIVVDTDTKYADPDMDENELAKQSRQRPVS